MSQATYRSSISVEDYLAGELQSDVRHEYLAGEVVAMVGASDRHGLIATALAAALYPHARQRGCQLFVADMKVRIDDARESFFYYPDLLLSCDPTDRESPYYRRRPCLIVEIASASTARIDRREKRLAYRLIPGLREYLIVEQDARRVELDRYPAGTHEVHTEGAFHLECLGCEIAIDAIYSDME